MATNIAEENRQRVLSHIPDVQASLYLNSRVSRYWYAENWECLTSSHHVVDDRDSSRQAAKIQSLLRPVDHQCATCVLVIEDISSTTISALNEIYEPHGIDKQLFAEHLVNSGFAGDTEANTWWTRRFGKDHISLKWHRPYMVNLPDRQVNLPDRKARLSAGKVNLEARKITMKSPLGYRTNPTLSVLDSNVRRRHLDLRCEDAIWDYESKHSEDLMNGDPLALEERVSIWEGPYGENYRLILILLDAGFSYQNDPSNEADDDEDEDEGETEGTDTDEADGGGTAPEVARLRQNSATSQPAPSGDLGTPNPFVHSNTNPVQSSPNEINSPNNGEHTHQSVSSPVISSETQVVDLDESDSICVAAEAGSNPQQLDLKAIANIPLPTPTESEAGEQITSSLRAAHHGSETFQRRNSVTSLNDEGSHSPGQDDRLRTPTLEAQRESPQQQTGFSEDQDENVDQSITESDRRRFFANVASRGPTSKFSVLDDFSTRLIAPLTTTFEDLACWMGDGHETLLTRPFPYGPFTVIFHIIKNDTLDFLQLIEHFIDSALAASDDENKLQKNIATWRKRVQIFGVELRSLEKSIPPFLGFLGLPPEDGENLLGEVRRLEGRLNHFIQFLVSSMALVESHKSIAEAESVSRLTELAFIYIPVSFAASFFGMQVKELNPSTTSIKWFVVMAVAVTALSYSVRLLIRSRVFIEPRQKMMADVRSVSGIPADRDVPLRAFLRWAFQKIALNTVGRLIGILLCTIIPLIPIWSSDRLADGMQVAMSINVSIVSVLLVASVVAIAVLSRNQSWAKRYIARGINRRSGVSQRDDEEQGTDAQ